MTWPRWPCKEWSVAWRNIRSSSRSATSCRRVYVDASLIVQAFGNLFDNLAKYTPVGTAATVSAVTEAGFLRVRIDDKGPGLPAGDPARLFDKFQRGSEEGSVAGVGLGLAICRAIVTAHGGEIQAGANPQGGARFEFTLPTVERRG